MFGNAVGRFLGGLVGLFLGLILGIMFNDIFAWSLHPLLNPIGTLIIIILPSNWLTMIPLPPAAQVIVLLLIWVVIVVLVTLLFYLVSHFFIRPLPAAPAVPAVVSPAIVYTVPGNGGERFGLGAMVGLTAGINFAIWSSVGVPGAIIAAILGLTGLLALFQFMTITGFYKVLLGWTSIIMPMTIPATIIGIIILIIYAVQGRIAGGAFDAATLTGEIGVSFPTPPGFTGFSLGHFTFLTFVGGAPPAAGLGAFTTPGSTSAHEVGHTLNSGAMGSSFLAINAIDENVIRPNPASAMLAYAEMCAESNLPTPVGMGALIRPYVPLWTN